MGQEWDFACILESGPLNMWKSLQLRERLEKWHESTLGLVAQCDCWDKALASL